MAKAAKEMEKRKEGLIAFGLIDDEAKEFIDKPYKDWKKDDLLVMIRWKQGPLPTVVEKGLSAMNKSKLKNLWESKYSAMGRPPTAQWTDEQESELERLEASEINSLQETAIYGRAVAAQNEYLCTKLKTVSKSRRMDVISGLYSRMTTQERTELTELLAAVDNNWSDDESQASAA
jgi:hypothetical protein